MKRERNRDPKCLECGISGTRTATFRGSVWCIRCIVFDIVRREKAQLGKALAVAREWCMCAYCGEHATDTEHVIARKTELPTYTVPSCRECNALAGADFFAGFFDKRDAIRERLIKKHSKILLHPIWSSGSKTEMGPAMLKAIEAYDIARRVLDERLRWQLEYLFDG